MKRILFVFLLSVFFAQGITVATGGYAMGARAVAAQDDAAVGAGMFDDLHSVAADVEEMSDYVAHDLLLGTVDRHATPVQASTLPLVSIDLPRAPPPPRA